MLHKKAERIVGSTSDVDLMKALGAVHFRRVVVTNKSMLRKPLSELGLDSLYSVAITRIVRAGVEMMAVPGI